MTLQARIDILTDLGDYMLSTDPVWAGIKEQAFRQNNWFIPDFIDLSVRNIAEQFLKKDRLSAWADKYTIKDQPARPKKVGVAMAGNIPLVGFHDFLSVFLSGHDILIKPSAKDEILIKHLVAKLYEQEITIQNHVAFAQQLKACDAYIATGSNNTSRYFEYYFGKYPHIIRRNRTSVAVLDGTETQEALELLADDIQSYFGMGCRNITQLYVPKTYDFVPLLDTLKKYEYLIEYHKYKHNYDYHLALLMMGNRYYMNNGSIVFTENSSPFSPVSQVHYQFYEDLASAKKLLENNSDIQCIVGNTFLPFGTAQYPSLTDYADGVDTLSFLQSL